MLRFEKAVASLPCIASRFRKIKPNGFAFLYLLAKHEPKNLFHKFFRVLESRLSVKLKKTNELVFFNLAERQGFEPWIQFDPHTRFPSVRLQPLGHLSKNYFYILTSSGIMSIKIRERLTMLDSKNKDKLFVPMTVTLTGVVAYFLLLRLADIIGLAGRLVQVLNPIIFAFMLAFVINILVINIEKLFKKVKIKHQVKRTISVVISFLLLLSLVAVIAFVALPNLTSSVVSLVNQTKNIDSFGSSANQWLSDRLPAWAVEQLKQGYVNTTKSASNWLYQSLQSIGTIATNFAFGLLNTILTIALAIYMVVFKEYLVRTISNFFKVFLPKKYYQETRDFLKIVNQSFKSFIQGQFIESIILSSLCYIGMRVFNFPYAELISALIGLSSFVPLFGLYVSIPISTLLLFVVSPAQAIYFLIFIVILQQIEGNFIYPRVLGNSVGLNPFWVLVGLVIGNSLFGFFGIILAIPLFSAFGKIISAKIETGLKQKTA